MERMKGTLGYCIFWGLVGVCQGSVSSSSDFHSCLHFSTIGIYSLNMRTTISIYRQLGKFIEVMDAEASARGEGLEDKSIDAHFRSGVYLGVGMSNLILSLMPAKLLTIVELFGYKGDRHAGLEILCKAGGWTKENDEPSIRTGMHILDISFHFRGLIVST